MDQKTCYYCGTKYPADEDRCPLCGQTETEPEAVDEVPVDLRAEEAPRTEEKAKKQKKEKSGAASTVICIVLGALVLAGIIFILSALGVLPFGKTTAGENVALPAEEEVVACTSLTVTPETISFTQAGQKQLFTITRKPAGCTEELTCEVQNPAVATVNEKCEVTAVAEGETDVIITCGDQTATLHVTFAAPEETQPEETTAPEETTEPTEPTETTELAETSEALAISNEDFTLFTAGETTNLTVTGASGSVQWSSNDTSVATVDGGKVTAVGPGVATITATADGKSVKAIVRCRFEATSAPIQTVSGDLTISHDDVTLTNGESFTISMISGGSRVSGVSWATSNSSVAWVDANGKVTASGSGMATITGTYGGTKLSCIVRCK